MKSIRLELKWSIIFTLATLIWMMLEHTFGWDTEFIAERWWITLFFIPIGILFFYLALKEKRRRHYNGSITWLQAFGSGCLLSLFIALLSPLTQYISQEYIAPSYFGNIIAYSVDNRILTRQEAVENFHLQSYILQSAIGALVAGILTSAVVAIIIRRKQKDI